jgi:putative SOS response-associated peptidase YedK
MCGRFARHRRQEVIARFLSVDRDDLPEDDLSYNIAPTQDVMAVRADTGGKRFMCNLRWGLIPSWAKDQSIAAYTSNARAETLLEKPSFRTAFRSRRCLIPADGFYEWSKKGKEKVPYFIKLKSDDPIVFAGLWDRWKDPAGRVIESCTIVTTTPNELVGEFHHRMAAILRPESFSLWLDPGFTRAEELLDLLAPYPADEMEAYRVSKLVNNSRNNSPECMKALDSDI